MNWGHKIIIVFAIFVSLVMFAVYTATKHRTDLVAEDYYRQELMYQDKIDKINRAITNDYLIEINDQGKFIQFVFPEEVDLTQLNGQIVFFRPSDEMQDKVMNIDLDNHHGMQVSKSHLNSGRYKIMIDWSLAGEEYYQEKELFVQ